MISNYAHTSNSTHSQIFLRHLQLYFNNSGNLGQIRKIEISKESGGYEGHDYDICACASKHACIQSVFWLSYARISAKLGWIREIKVYLESGEHAGPVLAQNTTQVCKLVCMHAICLHAQDHISAKLGRIREIKVYMELE